jgi:DNA polymerase-3 subunit beta
MKYVVTSTLLYSRLQLIDRVITQKNSFPILSCFLFKIKDNNLEVTATDNDTTLKCNIALTESDSDSSFAIPAKQLLGILKEIPEQPLAIEYNPTTLQIDITYQNGHFSLQAEPGDEFPALKKHDGEGHRITLEAATLSRGFASAIIAASNDEARKVMNGIFIDITPQDLSVVASDGHKLVCYKIICDTNNTTTNFILPRKPATLLRSIIDKMSGDITLCTYDDGSAVIEADSFNMTCRLLQEKYPNYKNVIPQNNTNIATIDKASLQSAVRRVLVASDKATSLCKFTFEPGKVTLITENQPYAQSAEEKIVCQYEGTPLRIGFRGDYLLELLSTIQSQDVILRLSDPSRAGLILPSEQEKNTDVIMLLMPLLIAN